MGTRIGWVVDAQRDFMEPEGRLYVRDLFDESDAGAARIEGTLAEVVDWMARHTVIQVYTGDWHGYEDEEIDPVSPDPQAGTYPPHCMGRSEDPAERKGAEVIPAVAPADPLVLALGATRTDAEAVAERALAEERPVFIQKNRFDVFAGNPATDAFVSALSAEAGPLEIFVAGVARDVCVTQAVDGLQERGYDVTAIRDATWGLGLEDEHATLERWRRRGRVVYARELPGDQTAAHG